MEPKKQKFTEEFINEVKSNLFSRSKESIENYEEFLWHKKANLKNSSQVLAIDFWGCIKTSNYKDEIINLIFNKNESDWDICFEYENKSLLAEPKSTQIDILLESKGNIALFIESKFTEKDGGKCSQTQKRTDSTHKGLVQCSGNYEEQINPVNKKECNCSLTGKGIKYWEYIDKLTEFKKEETYRPCPIRGGEYQWIRNICFAEAYSENNNVKTETYLAYLDSAKCPMAIKVKDNNYLGSLKGKLNNNDAFLPISYYELLDKIIGHFEARDNDEKQVFFELKNWIKQKEESIN